MVSFTLLINYKFDAAQRADWAHLRDEISFW